MRLNVFDLDHTLITVNSSFHFGLHLYHEHFFSFWKMILCLNDYAQHKWFGMPIDQLHTKAFIHLFKGRQLKQIQHHTDQFLSKKLKGLLNKKILMRLQESQDRGDYTMILSSSPSFLVGEIAQRLHVNLWEATTYQADQQGKLVNIERIFEGQNKADYVKAFALKRSLPSAAITVYTDSYLDLPLMQAAGKAVGVNPDKYLRRICLQNEWEIL